MTGRVLLRSMYLQRCNPIERAIFLLLERDIHTLEPHPVTTPLLYRIFNHRQLHNPYYLPRQLTEDFREALVVWNISVLLRTSVEK